MKILFTAWILIGGSWVHGSNFDGWSPLLAPDEATCEAWLDFTTTFDHPDVKFTCEDNDGQETNSKTPS